MFRIQKLRTEDELDDKEKGKQKHCLNKAFIYIKSRNIIKGKRREGKERIADIKETK